MTRGARVRSLGLLVLAGLCSLTVAAVGTATAKIQESAPTKYFLSATRAPDGTITAMAKLTSSDPRCLSRERFAQWRPRGEFKLFDTSELLYQHAPKPYPESSSPARL
jgi:hypothetical protein